MLSGIRLQIIVTKFSQSAFERYCLRNLSMHLLIMYTSSAKTNPSIKHRPDLSSQRICINKVRRNTRPLLKRYASLRNRLNLFSRRRSRCMSVPTESAVVARKLMTAGQRHGSESHS